jgi:SAM-dependent methyltransferase
MPYADFAKIAGLPRAYGSIDANVFSSEKLDGWIFVPDQELVSVKAYVDGEFIASAELQPRPDVARIYHRMPFALHSGFHVSDPRENRDAKPLFRVSIVGCAGPGGDGEVARFDTICFSRDLIPQIPIPPADLLRRIQGDERVDYYRLRGFRFYLQMRDAIAKHREIDSVKRILDWGCGTGCVTSSFILGNESWCIDGCDIDKEAITWCAENIPGGRFQPSDECSPLPYANGVFDVVIALGVVGSAGTQVFERWLPELRRVLAPRGIVLITVHGPFGARVRFPREALSQLTEHGLFNGFEFDARNPPDSRDIIYRGGYFLSPHYVATKWTQYFRVLEHREGEMNSDQDLVILERD